MELKEQLKAHRTRLGLSQEELAERIYVSRQTISNWETDRTYPDVQSLLLLSSLFETSIDELVKGDVEAMEETIKKEWKKMSRLATAAWILVGIGLACLVAGFAIPTGPSSVLTNLSEGEVLGFVLFLVFWAIGMVLIGMVEYLKKVNDLVTYRDILAFSRGEEPAREGAKFGRKHPLARSILYFTVTAFAGAIIGLVIFHLV